MVGNARLDNDFGITVDGAGDYVELNGVGDYAGDGSFTVSLWFTRQGECNVDDRYEYLYTHVKANNRECPPLDPTDPLCADPDYLSNCPRQADCSQGASPYDRANPGIHVILACGNRDTPLHLRIILVDDAGTRAYFRVALDSLDANGLISAYWVHAALTVSPDAAYVFLDGARARVMEETPTTRGGGAFSWRTTDCRNATATAASLEGCNAAYSDDPDVSASTFGLPLSTFDLASSKIVLAGQADSWGGGGRMFFGSMAGIGLFSDGLAQVTIRCLNRYDSERLASCTDPDTWWGQSWSGSFLQGAMPAGARLQGDASLDGRFGLQLDGEGDYVVLPEPPAFAADGTFAISLWFYKSSDCDVPEEFEYLVSTRKAGPSSWRNPATIWDPDYSGVHMFLGCAERGAQSTVDGNVLRTFLVDEAGTRATFDYALSAARSGGSLTDSWVHALLQVSSSSIDLYIDGEMAQQSAIGYSLGEDNGGNWNGSPNDDGSINQNAAFPSISNLNPPLAGFDFSERYQDFEVYTYTTELRSVARSNKATCAELGWDADRSG